MKNLPLNLLLSLVLAVFLILWMGPLWTVIFIYPVVTDAHGPWGRAQYTVLFIMIVGLIWFGIVMRRVWKAWRSIPEALQPKSPPGMQLRESDAPELFAMAARVKAETGMQSPVECWCDVSPTISAVAYAEHVAAGTKVALRHGIAALAVMTREQLEILLHYHLTILTFSPRLMSMLLKARLLSNGFAYFSPYVKGFNWSLHKVERYARSRAANLEAATAVIGLSQEISLQFQVFWMTEMQMFLNTGNLMPVAEGFAQFWRAHHDDVPEQPAIRMVEGIARVESRLTSEMLKANPGIEQTSWEQGGVVLLESWKEAAAEHAEGLSGIAAGELCRLIGDGGVALGSRLFPKPERTHEPEELRRWTSQILGMALAAALDKAGWKFEYTGAASKIRFECGSAALEPFQAMQQMLDGSTDCAEWRARCESMGIAELQLA